MAVELSAAGSCYRALLLAINVVFFLCGLALIVVGGISLGNVFDFFSSKNLGIGLIILGVFAFIVSLLGCLGALRSNRGLLKVYFAVVLLILIIQIGLSIAAFVYRDDIPELAGKAWDAADDTGKQDVQDLFNCCGWETVNDSAVPADCAEQTGRTDACQDATVAAIEDNFTAIAVTALVIGLFELLILVLSCCLIAKIPTKDAQEQALLDEARQANRGAPVGGSSSYQAGTKQQTSYA